MSSGLQSWVRYTKDGYISRQNQQYQNVDGLHHTGISRLKWVSKRNPIIKKIIRIGMYIYFFVVMRVNGKN